MFSRNVLQARLFHPNYTVADDPYSYPTPNIEPEHFWSKRDDVKKVRRQVLFQWVFVSIQLWILIFLMAALYLGQGRNPDGYTRNLDVLVVNFDQELAGDFFIDAFEQSGPGSLTLHWHYRAPSDFSFDPNNTRMEVSKGKVWASVFIQQGTTQRINQTLEQLVNGTKRAAVFTPSMCSALFIVIILGLRHTKRNWILCTLQR
ncbi:unnamed protein product [Didymodactylos carnosus]|uniref:DUF3533 domain-containing protein n=1 Tax=Didymodactylos carnosus TaxID=1234261 RepID=A0A8S2DD26_9BILA|nr:unnamed protein product [Didymodactylos carnosus]CAF3651076.1 unnamed protein product [Didymodactylos carnosus]